jgi:hypothetical protein
MGVHLRNHVLEYLALFVALGGTAYATHPGGADTISSVDIQNHEVREPDIAVGAVGPAALQDGGVAGVDLLDGGIKSVDVGDSALGAVDVRDDDLRGADVRDDNLTGADVREATLALGGQWHEVGAAGEPPFNDTGGCAWKNFDPPAHDTGAFSRDRSGRVQLKGIVDADDVPPSSCALGSGLDQVIFTLPAGYRPDRREVQPVVTNGDIGAINIDPNGDVELEHSAIPNSGLAWVALGGISFRCAPAGSDGCQ